MAQRMSEAQHAVRRLQQECEHQLEMEKGRAADVEGGARASLAERVEEANARAAAVERAFHGYKKAHLESSEGEPARGDRDAAAAPRGRRAHTRTTLSSRATDSRRRSRRWRSRWWRSNAERTYLRAALANLSARPDGAENAENAPPKSERPRVLRGVAPPKPAPSAADFATDLFGGAEKPSEPQLEADPFLREFRESVAALDAEAAFGDEPKAAKPARGPERAAGAGASPFRARGHRDAQPLQEPRALPEPGPEPGPKPRLAEPRPSRGPARRGPARARRRARRWTSSGRARARARPQEHGARRVRLRRLALTAKSR